MSSERMSATVRNPQIPESTVTFATKTPIPAYADFSTTETAASAALAASGE